VVKYPEEGIDQYKKLDWWFFDTNCLSEIVKGYVADKRATIDAFLRGQYVIIPPTVLSGYRCRTPITTSHEEEIEARGALKQQNTMPGLINCGFQKVMSLIRQRYP